MRRMVSKIGIIGLGLIGGSLAKSLKRADKGYEIFAYDNDEVTIEEAFKSGAVDHKVVDFDNFSGCDVVFLCIPVYSMETIITQLKPILSEQCILTDVGSTKGDVISIVQKVKIKQPFIGGHPLAGSEKSGYKASKANLFENAYYCLTPMDDCENWAFQCLEKLIKDMGAIPIKLTTQEHDRATATISHVPHVVAALLVNLLIKLDSPSKIMKTIAAGGFKDITRIASSSPELWTGICFSNKEIILETLSEMKSILSSFENNLIINDKNEVQEYFKTARDMRKTFSERKSLIQKTFDIIVDVDDKPGIIAVIAAALAKENINIKNIGILNNRENEDGALEIQFENEEARSFGIKALNLLGYKAKVLE